MGLVILTESNQDLLQSVKPKTIASYQSGLTQRAPDRWESARFQAICVAEGWFRQSGAVSSRPPAGNANRWVAETRITENKNLIIIIMGVKSPIWTGVHSIRFLVS